MSVEVNEFTQSPTVPEPSGQGKWNYRSKHAINAIKVVVIGPVEK